MTPRIHTGSAIDGMTSFSFPLAQSYIADITEPARLSQAYGLFQVKWRKGKNKRAERKCSARSLPPAASPYIYIHTSIQTDQGVATGGAFLLGIPLAGILAAKVRSLPPPPFGLGLGLDSASSIAAWLLPPLLREGSPTPTRPNTQVDLKLPLYIAASICAVNIVYITAFLPESLPPARRRHDAGLHVRERVRLPGRSVGRYG